MLSRYTTSLKIYCSVILYAHVLLFIYLFPVASLILLIIAIPSITFAMGMLLVSQFRLELLEELPGNAKEKRLAFYDFHYGTFYWSQDVLDDYGPY